MVLKFNILMHYERFEAAELLKSTSGQIQDGAEPPNFNHHYSAADCSISLKFVQPTEFHHITADTVFKVKGSKVMVT